MPLSTLYRYRKYVPFSSATSTLMTMAPLESFEEASVRVLVVHSHAALLPLGLPSYQ